jgi:hypothetical protein
MIADIFIYAFTALFILVCVFGAIDFYKTFIKKNK